MTLPEEKVVVSTNLGAAYRCDGSWFIWDIHNGVSAFKPYPDQSAFKWWEPLRIEPWMRIPTLEQLEASKRYQSLRYDFKFSTFWDRKMGWFRPIYYFVPALSGFIAGLMLIYLCHSHSEMAYYYVALAVFNFAAHQLSQAERDYRSWIRDWDYLRALERHQMFLAHHPPRAPGCFGEHFDDNQKVVDLEEQVTVNRSNSLSSRQRPLI